MNIGLGSPSSLNNLAEKSYEIQILKVEGMDRGGKLMTNQRTVFVRNGLRHRVVKATAEQRAGFF